jgi:propanol-preferring alcohol dehydrogenase
MKAAVLTSPNDILKRPLEIREVPRPQLSPGQILLRVRACGVCRTDLHIVEGELPPHCNEIIPGHQIVGEIADSGTTDLPIGARVGVSWIAGVDGSCWYCQHGMENLCDAPIFTGYSLNGGYAEYATARADFTLPLDNRLDDLQAAPLLCAGIIGFRSLRVAEVQHGERVGLFGFGASAHLAIAVLRAWNCEVFAPSGDVVVAALASLRKGGVVAVNAIHLDRIPQFDYDRLLWGERQIRSVTNMTRLDARDFLQIAGEINLRPSVTAFSLDQANEALAAVKNDSIDGAAVIVMEND